MSYNFEVHSINRYVLYQLPDVINNTRVCGDLLALLVSPDSSVTSDCIIRDVTIIIPGRSANYSKINVQNEEALNYSWNNLPEPSRKSIFSSYIIYSCFLSTWIPKVLGVDYN